MRPQAAAGAPTGWRHAQQVRLGAWLLPAAGVKQSGGAAGACRHVRSCRCGWWQLPGAAACNHAPRSPPAKGAHSFGARITQSKAAHCTAHSSHATATVFACRHSAHTLCYWAEDHSTLVYPATALPPHSLPLSLSARLLQERGHLKLAACRIVRLQQPAPGTLVAPLFMLNRKFGYWSFFWFSNRKQSLW